MEFAIRCVCYNKTCQQMEKTILYLKKKYKQLNSKTIRENKARKALLNKSRQLESNLTSLQQRKQVASVITPSPPTPGSPVK